MTEDKVVLKENERIDDLQEFDPAGFAAALFGDE